MVHTVKIWLRVIIGFSFAVCVLLGIISYALIGTVATDSLEIIITEATGTQTQEAIFLANLQPLNIQITLYFAIAGMALCLIFLYFLDQHLRVFVAPGVICLFSVLFLQILIRFFAGFIHPNISAAVISYIDISFTRANHGSLFAAGLGLLLVVASYLDYKKIQRAAA
jgi:hypothetical protein